jgi:hypothetical protein
LPPNAKRVIDRAEKDRDNNHAKPLDRPLTGKSFPANNKKKSNGSKGGRSDKAPLTKRIRSEKNRISHGKNENAGKSRGDFLSPILIDAAFYSD